MKYQNTQKTIQELKNSYPMLEGGIRVKDVANALSVTPRAVHYRLKSGKLKRTPFGTITLDSLAKLMKSIELIKELRE